MAKDYIDDFKRTEEYINAAQSIEKAEDQKARALAVAKRIAEKATIKIAMEKMRLDLRYQIFLDRRYATRWLKGKRKKSTEPSKGAKDGNEEKDQPRSTQSNDRSGASKEESGSQEGQG